MLFKLIRDAEKNVFQRFEERVASDLELTEKDLENWMAENPELLFGREKVLVISQSVSGQSMADILALDADGCLVIVEIKRDWSDRATVGQLLEYAAAMVGHSHDDLEDLHKRYWTRRAGVSGYKTLLERFRELTDDPRLDESVIPRRERGHRICIVAPRSDEGLLKIVDWLEGYGVPISFLPFTLHACQDDAEVLLEIEPLSPMPSVSADTVTGWQGDWFFNTNETHARDAYRKMFAQGVIGIYGYENGSANLTGGIEGQRVFAYVNRKGILGVGDIVDRQPVPGNTVFGEDQEFHLKVEWQVTVTDAHGVTMQEVSEAKNYNLPVRNVFCAISRHDVADWIAEQLRQRAGSR